MENYKLNSGAGDTFEKVSQRAKEIASMEKFKGDAVEFEFNGVVCIVNKTTNLEYLWRDYCNAHTMDWKVVGPDCLSEYEPEVKSELDRRNKDAAERSEQRQREAEAKDRFERETFQEKTKGVEIELTDAKAWNEWRDKNDDPYGRCCFDYAEGWAKLMQIEIANGKTLVDCASETSYQLGFYGITGFMYGAAVSILAKCWKHGEQLRKWHNKDYGHEGEGVVNPAILTISDSK